jgi:5-methylcytosine-specific restriction enzyme subunit McrC
MAKPLQIFEYERLNKDKIVEYFKDQQSNITFSLDELKIFERKADKIIKQFEQYYDREIDKNKSKEKAEIFSLIKDGVKFKQYVGVVRIGSLTIEILPKIDQVANNDEADKKLWQSLLYKMVRKATNLDAKLTGFANLNFHSNNFISMYISYFVKEVAYLNRTGLIKKYHRKEENLASLKGRLNFSKQICKNLVHAERFYVNYTTYDRDNFLNQILLKALIACRRINTSADLSGKIEAEILTFPDVSNINISDATFNKINFDRKSNAYKNAISLARFILMKLFPALKSGQTDTIAVMYDMNKLYEKYIEVKLREALGIEYRVTAQDQIPFWKFNTNNTFRKVKPDLVVYRGEEVVAVLDTKWKIPKEEQFPSIQDLRQMFVYNQYYFNDKRLKRAALVYPNIEGSIKEGKYNTSTKDGNNLNFGTCDVVYVTMQKPIAVENDIKIRPSEYDIDITKLVEYISKG